MIIAHLYNSDLIFPVSYEDSLYYTLCGIKGIELPRGHNVFYYVHSISRLNGYEPCDKCLNHPIGQMKLLSETNL